jgi:nitrile hydratase beta subunit
VNGAHDAGGMMGFGPVLPEPDEPVFHEKWEARMFALMSAVGDVGGWSLDEDRSACESMHPAQYVSSSYYEHWLHGLEMLLQKKDIASADEIATGITAKFSSPVTPTRASDVWTTVTARGSYERPAQGPARFGVGDRVCVRRVSPPGHTRLPCYLRGVAGEIIRIHGAHVFPDSNALGLGEDPRWLYTVRFQARGVWDGVANTLLHADLWEPYLEPV